MKVRNLKANHSSSASGPSSCPAVLGSVKVRNLKANHSLSHCGIKELSAVLASMKVRNLEANHNRDLLTTAYLVVIVMDYWYAYE